ncbi:WhiB family transcriptional regulator [Rhodococcoides fascians]|uniref:WhiB family transcriptional regulator n=1 Tax=Rhodococcoides fascians TaxID=1828 RepID=UPI0009B840B0|nr:WhiB family transcriptional regulator [Rhodococcus fascians]
MRERPLVLPAPTAEMWQWQLRARCRGKDSTIFFDYGNAQSNISAETDLAAARRICNACPVMQKCLDHAVASNESFGVWGGLTPEERASHRWRVRAISATWEQALQRNEHRTSVLLHELTTVTNVG